MDKPTPEERIQHMRESIARIQGYVQDMDMEAFENDRRTQSAVLFEFVIIGEAVRHVDPDMLRHHHYPWHLVRAFRNFIAHEYHAIRLERIFHAANDLRPLDDMLRVILDTEFK